MPFVKVIKSTSYFKRFQVKYRRRREGKTDYRARKRLVAQDKNKYNSPKYRFVVRISNKDIVAQIAYSKIDGDHILAAAYAHELKNYGMPVGQTNYSAAYAVGLLVARRLLTNLKLADKYKGNAKIDGNDYNVESIADGPRAFRAFLDVGLHRTTTGSKVFAALKGATDGGIEIPHSPSRFVGYNKEEKALKADVLRKHIFGGHIADYMKHLRDENNTKYTRHFGDYIKANIKPEELEKRWTAVHKAIKDSPAAKKSTKPKPEKQKRFRRAKMTLSEKKNRIKQKIAYRERKAASNQ
jgi:large subunit ribosomal protein L5e